MVIGMMLLRLINLVGGVTRAIDGVFGNSGTAVDIIIIG
jgi:hypothetical protein